jgi:hypothetical protein
LSAGTIASSVRGIANQAHLERAHCRDRRRSSAGPQVRFFKSHARGRVFKLGTLIGRRISAASKSSSVSDKNRGGGAAVMPC